MNEAYYYIRGLLSAFEALNDKTDHVCSYTLDALDRAGSVHDDLNTFFDGSLTSLTLDPIESWRDHLYPILERWLFAFIDANEHAHLVDAMSSFSISDRTSRLFLVDEAIQMLGAAVEPCTVWRAQIETRGFYECVWDDVVFEQPRQLYFLHLGWSD